MNESSPHDINTQNLQFFGALRNLRNNLSFYHFFYPFWYVNLLRNHISRWNRIVLMVLWMFHKRLCALPPSLFPPLLPSEMTVLQRAERVMRFKRSFRSFIGTIKRLYISVEKYPSQPLDRYPIDPCNAIDAGPPRFIWLKGYLSFCPKGWHLVLPMIAIWISYPAFSCAHVHTGL